MMGSCPWIMVNSALVDGKPLDRKKIGVHSKVLPYHLFWPIPTSLFLIAPPLRHGLDKPVVEYWICNKCLSLLLILSYKTFPLRALHFPVLLPKNQPVLLAKNQQIREKLLWCTHFMAKSIVNIF